MHAHTHNTTQHMRARAKDKSAAGGGRRRREWCRGRQERARSDAAPWAARGRESPNEPPAFHGKSPAGQRGGPLFPGGSLRTDSGRKFCGLLRGSTVMLQRAAAKLEPLGSRNRNDLLQCNAAYSASTLAEAKGRIFSLMRVQTHRMTFNVACLRVCSCGAEGLLWRAGGMKSVLNIRRQSSSRARL